MLELLDLVLDVEEGEIERSRIERRQLGLEVGGDTDAVLDGLPELSPGGEAHDDVAALPHGLGDLPVDVLVGVRHPRLGVTDVDVDDGGARLVGADGLLDELLRRHRQVG